MQMDSISLSEYGYEGYYIMFSDGSIYNKKTGKLCPMYKWNYSLKLQDGSFKNVSLRSLYKQVFGKYFYIDQIQDLPGEEWKQIDHHEKYFVSNRGRIKSIVNYNAMILKARRQNKGYYRIIIDKKNYLVHRLVANAFVYNDDPINKKIVDHIDEDPANNNADNLQWTTSGENIHLHYIRKKLKQ